jgi:hypothetical protein
VQIGLYTDSVAELDFLKALDFAADLGVHSIVTESGCPGDSEQSRLPHWIVYRWPPEYLEVLEWQWEPAIRLWRDL